MRKWLITFINSFQVTIRENIFLKNCTQISSGCSYITFSKHPGNTTLPHDKEIIEKKVLFFSHDLQEIIIYIFVPQQLF